MPAGIAPLRIGVNALYLIPGGVGGTEIYLRCLLQALANQDSLNHYVVFTNRETGPSLLPPAPNFEHAPQPVHARFRPARILWEQFALPWLVARQRLHVLLNPGFTSPVLCSCRQVTVFHDLQHLRHPEHFRWFDRPFWRVLLAASAHRSHRLIAVSEATRRDLLHYYRLPPDKIDVVHHGVDPGLAGVQARRAAAKPQPYFLCVSTLHPHKNLVRLLAAFAAVRARRPEFKLVLAGMRGFHTGAVEQMAVRLNLRDAVTMTGWIAREELCQLFEKAAAFVYPSTFEGFGLPVLEALACGIPCTCSDIPPLREIAGDAALFFDPSDEQAIRSAMLRLIEDSGLREELAVRGPQRAQRFTWEDAAVRTLASIRRCAQDYRSRSSS